VGAPRRAEYHRLYEKASSIFRGLLHTSRAAHRSALHDVLVRRCSVDIDPFSTDSFLGSWKAKGSGEIVDLSLECADDLRTDPFSRSAVSPTNQKLQHALEKAMAAANQLPPGTIMRSAVVRKSIFGTITIDESIDGGGVGYRKR
jgi:hypothetical protein